MQYLMISAAGVALTMAGTSLDSIPMIASGLALTVAAVCGAWAR